MAEFLEMLCQVEETVGFEEDEDPMLEVSDEEQELTEAELAAGAEELPEEAALAFNEVRVVGGENMMEEHPVTEGLALFDTGVKVGFGFWVASTFAYTRLVLGCSFKCKSSCCVLDAHAVATAAVWCSSKSTRIFLLLVSEEMHWMSRLQQTYACMPSAHGVH